MTLGSVRGNVEGDPAVFGYLEHPVPGEVLEPHHVSVYGWAVVNQRPALGVVIEVDGQPIGLGAVTIPRPDVADLYGDPGLVVSGFALEVDLDPLARHRPGDQRTIGVWAMGARRTDDGPPGAFLERLATATITLAAPEAAAAGYLDAPEEGVEVERGPLLVRGWALGPAGAVGAVEVLIGGVSHGRARLGLPRPDVAQVHPGHFAPIAGFEALVDLSLLDEHVREVEIEVYATDLSGTRRLVGRRCCPVALVRGEYGVHDADENGTERQQEERLERVARSRAETLDPATDLIDPATDKLSLLVVTHDLGLGGAQLWLSELLERSGAGREYACAVVTQNGGALHGQLEDLGVRIHVTTPFPVHDAEAYEGRVHELALLVRRFGANVVLANTAYGFPAADVADRLGLPCLWAIHESFPPSIWWSVFYPPKGVDPLVRSRVEEVLARNPVVVFEAESTLKQYAGVVPASHARVVPYGVNTIAIDRYRDTVTREEARGRCRLAPEDRVLLVMGTIEPRKSQILLAQAFAAIAPAHPEARLVFVGDIGGDYARALRRFIDDTGLSGQMRVEPVTRDPYSWYCAADVLVSSSDIESLPRSMLEAMCFGLPVLAASVFGVPELITDGATGYLFTPRSLPAAVAGLERVLIAGTASLASVSSLARAHVLAHHDSMGYSQKLKMMLTDLVRSGSRH